MSPSAWRSLLEFAHTGALAVGGLWLIALARELKDSRRLLQRAHRLLEEILIELQVERICEGWLESER